MADNKDFLSQFSEKDKPKKPESFNEEVRVAVSKPKKEIKPIHIIIPSIILVIIAAILVFVYVLPHIPVEDFTGKTQSDVGKWATQNNIEKTGIIFNEEYSLDYPSGQIISQTPSTGKIKKTSKMTFVISKGADPDVEIRLPDLENMTKSEIESWIKENSLLATKITTSYDDTVAEGNVIKVDYSNIDKDHFTRGTTLKITVSKGPKPAEQVTVKDYTKKTYTEFETWAKENKIEVTKEEAYSDDIDSGYIISQSVTSGKIAQGKTIKAVVSKGKGVKLPDFTSMTETEYNEWITLNSSFTNIKVTRSIYSDSGKYITYQSVKAGTEISTDEKVALYRNLGDGFYLADVFTITEGTTNYDVFKEWADNKAEEKGLEVDTHREYVNSDKPKNTILSISKISNGNDVYSTTQRLPLEVDITCVVSNGEAEKDETLKPMFTFTNDDLTYLNGSDGNVYSVFADYVDARSDKISKIKIVNSSKTVISDSIASTDKFKVLRFEYKDSNDVTTKYTPDGTNSISVPADSVLVIKKQ